MKNSLALLAALFILLAPASAHASPRVIGGKPADPSRWGFIVPLLASDNPDAYAAQLCGGSFIADRYVVTAAHCVTEGVENDNGEFICGQYVVSRPGTMQVAPGLSVLPSDSSEERVPVASISVHPEYDPCTTSNDVAVLELSTPSITPHSTIPLASTRVGEATGGSVAGWGTTEASKGSYPRRLMDLDLTVFSTAECNANMGGLLPGGVLPDSMVCAGVIGGAKDTCSGDSGGPLVVNGELAGLTSWGFGCATEQYGVYTNVPMFRDWILSKLVEGPPAASNISVAQGSNPTQAVVRWSGAAPAGSSWRVTARTASGTGSTKVVKSSQHGLRIKGLTPSTKYLVSITTTASSTPTVKKFTTRSDVVRPTPVVGLRAYRVTRTSVTLRWRGGFDFNTPVFGVVEWTKGPHGDVGSADIEVTRREVELAGLKPNTTYRYQIDVYDAAGNRGISSRVLFVTTRE